MGTVRPPGGVEVGGGGVGGAGQYRFSKNLICKRFAAKSFSKVSRSFSEGQKGSVNLTFNAFLHRKLCSMYKFVPGGPKGVV